MIAENSVAPWLDLRPGFYLDAAMKGAGLGLQRSKLATDADEAAARLQQSYASLGAQQAMHAATLGAEQQRNSAAMALAGARAKAADDARFARLGIANRHQDMLEGNAADRLKQALAVRALHVGKGVYGYNPATGEMNTLLPPPEELDPVAKLDYQDNLRAVRDIRSALYNPFTDAKSKTALQSQLDDALSERKGIIGRLRGKKSALPGGDESQGNPESYPSDDDVTDTAVSAADDLLGAGGDPALEPTEEDTQEGNVSGGTGAFKIGKYSVTPLK